MAEGHKDYSGTPLWKKLGIRQGSRVVLIGAPGGFDALLVSGSPFPAEVTIAATMPRGSRRRVDVAVLFATERRQLERRFGRLAAVLEPDGRLWVAWPKKDSEVETDLSFATVQRHGLDAGLVDNKTASITDAFQGCQFVFRVADRKRLGAPDGTRRLASTPERPSVA